MVTAPETKTAAEMKPEEKTIAEKKTQEVEKIKEDSDSQKEEMSETEKLEKAAEKFSAGKKSLVQNLAKESVDALAEACSLLSSVHGDMSPKMCEYYYYYGRALLELARIEEDVLGNALTGVPEGEDVDNSQVEDPDKLTAEEKETVAQQVEDALEENLITAEKAKEKSEDKSESTEKSEEEKSSDKTESTEKPEDKEEKMEEDKKEESNETSEEKDEEKEEEGEEEKEEEGEEETEEAIEGEEQQSQDEEDVSSLQLAWEVLELAKTIYLKAEDRSKEDTLKLAQVYLRLGEVCLENENYSESINMNAECLKLQEAILEADDRWLAETHYQLGLAHSFADNYDEAVKHITAAADVIETKVKNNKEALGKEDIKITEDLDESKLTEEQKSLVKDVKDMEKILPQVREKITDIKETKASFTEKMKAMKKQLIGEIGGSSSSTGTGFGDASSSTSSEAKPIATSMIRKKRKTEDEDSEGEKESKKAKTEENGKEESNGDAKKEEEMETEKTES